MGKRSPFAVMLTVCICFCVLSFSVLPSGPFAATGAPSILNYQGNLTDDAGNPVSGARTMSFRIYATIGANASEALWQSGDLQVEVVNGVFSVSLEGTAENPFPSNLFADDTRYLGVTVDGNELQERKRLASVPYALNAGSGVPKGVIVMWSGSADSIPEGWALCNGQNGTPDLKDRFIVGAGSGYAVGASGGVDTLNLSTVEVGAHNHHISVDLYSCIGDCSDGADDGSKSVGSDSHGHRLDADTTSSGTHSHTVKNAASGTTSIDNRPPYFALCFIMKL